MKKRAPFILIFGFIAFGSTGQSAEAWHNFNTDNSGLLHNVIQSFAVNNSDGSIWAGYPDAGGNGLGISRLKNGTWTHYNSTTSGLPVDGVRAMAADHNGAMWFGTYNAGLAKFDGTSWTVYNTSNSGIVHDIITQVQVDSHNNVWVGSYGYGISKFDGTTWTTYNSSNSPLASWVCVDGLVVDDADNVWIGMECGNGLVKKDAAGNWTTYTTANSSLAHSSVTSLMKDPSGGIWIGYLNRNKISSLNGNTWVTYTPFASNSSSVPYNGFTFDSQGNILCHTSDGLYELSNSSWNLIMVPQLGTSLNSVISITNDSDGNIWCGTYSGIWTNAAEVCALFTPPDDAVTEDEGTLIASDDDGLYQWLNCETNQPVPGAVEREYTPTESGDYAVEVSRNGCTVTSDCIPIEVPVEEIEVITGVPLMESRFRVYPNPATREVTIDVGQQNNVSRISVVSSLGVIVFEKTIKNQESHTLSTRELPPGIYLVVVEAGSAQRRVKKLIVK